MNASGTSFQCDKTGYLNNKLKDLPLPSGKYHFTNQNKTNVISLSSLSKEYRVTYDSFIDDAFYVFNEEGGYMRFSKSKRTNLYHCKILQNESGIVFNVMTSEGNAKHFSPLEVTRAKVTRNLQHKLLCPSEEDLKHAIENNIIGCSGLKAKDVDNARKIWGPSEPKLRGKTPALKSRMDREDERTDLPEELREKFQNVTLFIDVMHVNRIPFLVSKSAHIGHSISVPLEGLSAKEYKRALEVMINEYTSRGATIKNVLGDGAFTCLKTFLGNKQIDLDNPVAKKHVPEAERNIRDVKNRVRCARMMMPYTRVPRRFTIEMVKQATIMTSVLVRKNNNVHPVMSPRKLVTDRALKLSRLQLGQYLQAHLGGSNSVEEERTCDALYIGRSDSSKKGHLIFKLSTRQPISCNKVTPIPVTQDHIDWVNEIEKERSSTR